MFPSFQFLLRSLLEPPRRFQFCFLLDFLPPKRGVGWRNEWFLPTAFVDDGSSLWSCGNRSYPCSSIFPHCFAHGMATYWGKKIPFGSSVIYKISMPLIPSYHYGNLHLSKLVFRRHVQLAVLCLCVPLQ